MALELEQFGEFFEEIHGTGPFPWQTRLLRHVIEGNGVWPRLMDLPTGSGKTAALDIAVFHLALDAKSGEARRAPLRIAFVVDRRLVVDDAFNRAEKIARALKDPKGRVTELVASELWHFGDRLLGPLVARRLRGGLPLEDDWAQTPHQPTIICSTVDQVGSRVLFRGYGISDSMKPVQAGLFGNDCLVLLDEAHLAKPFSQTLELIGRYKSTTWRETDDPDRWQVVTMTATPGEDAQSSFALLEEDRQHPILARRLSATKPARLQGLAKIKTKDDEAGSDDDATDIDVTKRADAVVKQIHGAFEHFKDPENGVKAPAIGLVVNRVARARAVFDKVRIEFADQIRNGVLREPILLIGPARPIDRDDLSRELAPIRTVTADPVKPRLDSGMIVIATQCIEVGVDIDLDALITELAPLDSLRQRFGRLNRAGRPIVPFASIVPAKAELSTRFEDPIYGKTLRATWERLEDASTEDASERVVNFRLSTFSIAQDSSVTVEPTDAPILLPAHVDQLSQTSPRPDSDPEIGIYLHGAEAVSDAVSIVWRADIEGLDNESIRSLLVLVPPRATEAIELPVWAVRRWLRQPNSPQSELADVPGADPDQDESSASVRTSRRAFRWRGNDERSKWLYSQELRPGDTIVVPSSYGGLDKFGWNPKSRHPVADVAREAARHYAGRKFVVRISAGLLANLILQAKQQDLQEGVAPSRLELEPSGVSQETLSNALASSVSRSWRDLREAVLGLTLPEDVASDLRRDLDLLDHGKTKRRIVAYPEIYGLDDDGRPKGVIFVAPVGINLEDTDNTPVAALVEQSPSTEDDILGSIPGYELGLEPHLRAVGKKAEEFAKACGLPERRIHDIRIAGSLHDLGKRDPRFQAWLRYNDPFGGDDDELLAKSGRRLPRSARSASGLPDKWRHEALSVKLSIEGESLKEASDPELVLWLIGSHHGYGLPLFPHCDPSESLPNVGPQSLEFSWNGLDWPSIHARVKARYGVWSLAYFSAILRLADHRSSDEAARSAGSK